MRIVDPMGVEAFDRLSGSPARNMGVVAQHAATEVPHERLNYRQRFSLLGHVADEGMAQVAKPDP
jgi:hypothetical protein